MSLSYHFAMARIVDIAQASYGMKTCVGVLGQSTRIFARLSTFSVIHFTMLPHKMPRNYYQHNSNKLFNKFISR